jgi:hypothetical protein
MSAQGGTIRAPLHVPVRPVVAIVTAAAAVALMFGAIQATRELAPNVATVTQLDWSPTTGHPAVRDRFGNEESDADRDRPFDSIIKRYS